MRAVTDSEGSVRYDREAKPGVSNLLVIYAALTGRQIPAIEDEYAGRGYGDFKKGLAEVVVNEFGPVRQRALELLDDPAELDRVLAANAAQGRGGREPHARRRVRQGRAAPPGVAAPGAASRFARTVLRSDLRTASRIRPMQRGCRHVNLVLTNGTRASAATRLR